MVQTTSTFVLIYANTILKLKNVCNKKAPDGGFLAMNGA